MDQLAITFEHLTSLAPDWTSGLGLTLRIVSGTNRSIFDGGNVQACKGLANVLQLVSLCKLPAPAMVCHSTHL